MKGCRCSFRTGTMFCPLHYLLPSVVQMSSAWVCLYCRETTRAKRGVERRRKGGSVVALLHDRQPNTEEEEQEQEQTQGGHGSKHYIMPHKAARPCERALWRTVRGYLVRDLQHTYLARGGKPFWHESHAEKERFYRGCGAVLGLAVNSYHLEAHVLCAKMFTWLLQGKELTQDAPVRALPSTWPVP